MQIRSNRGGVCARGIRFLTKAGIHVSRGEAGRFSCRLLWQFLTERIHPGHKFARAVEALSGRTRRTHIVLILSLVSSSSVWPCADALEKLTKVDSVLADKVHAFFALAPEILSGSAKPGWQEFDVVAQLITRLKTLKEDQPAAFRRAQKLAPEISRYALRYSQAFSKVAKRSPDKPYAPGEYGLVVAFQEKLQELNKWLPKKIPVPIRELPLDRRADKLPRDGVRVVLEVDAKFMELLPTSGFATEEAFEKALEELVRQMGGGAQELLEAMKQERLQVVIRRPSRGRFWIPRTGFQNQHVTGSSNGMFGPAERDIVEANYLGISVEEYRKFDNELKANYLGFRMPPGSGWSEYFSSQYGDDIYVLKLEAVRDRLTWTPGDSLNRNPDYQSRTASSWDHLMVPWRHRLFMVPFLLNAARHRNFQTESKTQAGLGQFTVSWRTGSSYSEGQLWGGGTLDTVAEFHFTKQIPEGDFLESLKAHRIPIYDARQDINNPEVWWVPPKEKKKGFVLGVSRLGEPLGGEGEE